MAEGLIVGLGSYEGRDEVDMTGKIVCPGFIDAHNHFDLDVCDTATAGDFASGSRAALRGGTTTIVEHMGMIPARAMPTSIIKATEPQLVLRETAADDMDHWRGGDRGEEVTMVPVIMQGFQIYQPPGGGACWGVPLYLVDMLERDPAEHIGADVIDKDRLLWEADGEAVVINAVRKACSGWAKEWERAVWNALEGVDLHKEEAGR